MTRQQIENEILQMMQLLDQGGSTTYADAATETYIQTRIQEAHDRIWMESRATWTRKVFGMYLRAPVTGSTISFTQGEFTGTVAAANTPSENWIGGHVWVSANLAPLRVVSYSGQVLTFAEPVQATTDAAASYIFYYSGAMLPTDCRAIMENTMKLHGKRGVSFLKKADFDNWAGYLASSGTDYGRIYRGRGAITAPDTGQPSCYIPFESYKDSSNYVRPVINFYPFPDGVYSVTFDGWMKPPALSGDSDTSKIPEQYHRTAWLPLVKLLMCEYPGFEMSAQERDTVSAMYKIGLQNMKDESQFDTSELTNIRPASCLQ